MTTHATRAVLFAKATVATLKCRRLRSPESQAGAERLRRPRLCRVSPGAVQRRCGLAAFFAVTAVLCTGVASVVLALSFDFSGVPAKCENVGRPTALYQGS
jgi:hypothetical protein